MNVNTIGDLYVIDGGLPQFELPHLSFDLFRDQMANGITIAILAAIESLLSCVVADSMISSHHRCNMELVAQGAGNIASVLFGGIPATGAIARTAANVKNGGRTPIAAWCTPWCCFWCWLSSCRTRRHPHAHHRRHLAARGVQHVGLAQLRAFVPHGFRRARSPRF